MADERSLDNLMTLWAQARAEGRTVTPEELCGSCPEQIPDLRRQIADRTGLNSTFDTHAHSAGAGASSASPTINGPADASGDRPLPPGVGRFRVLSAHARGGLGEVFIARDEELDRDVALKRIRPGLADDPISRRRFEMEAAVTARLEHPGVVPIHGLVRDVDGQPCYAMRFIHGESMAAAIARLHGRTGRASDGQTRSNGPQAPLTLRQLLQRFVTVCNTIAYAHSKGIVHRDLKPHNVMLGPFGETLVVDWGLAKNVSRLEQSPETNDDTSPRFAEQSSHSESQTQTGQALGTPA